MVIPLSVESAIHYHDAIGVDNLPASRLFSKVGRLKSGAPPTGMATKLGMATNWPEARCEGAAGFQPLLKLQNPLKLQKLLKRRK